MMGATESEVELVLERFFAGGEDGILRLYRKKDESEEICYNIKKQGKEEGKGKEVVLFLLRETFLPEDLSHRTFLDGTIIEFGPRPNFASAWSSTCVSILNACGVRSIVRIEASRRYSNTTKTKDELHDRMTECEYLNGIPSFEKCLRSAKHKVERIPILKEGRSALEKANHDQCLGFDDFDLDYYYSLFVTTLKRDPTQVELYDMSQSNSEHSRHWFFGGKMIIDGEEKQDSLFQLVKKPLAILEENNMNESASLVAFHDNSSVIRGGFAPTLVAYQPETSSVLLVHDVKRHALLTAETHNFPSAVAPFPGAETGTGGRLRDVQATGRGAHPVAGIAGYCVGEVQNALNVPHLTSSEGFTTYPNHLAAPLKILIEASDGASDYGNKFGEPVIAGYCRSFQGLDASLSRCEWIKPVMFSAGIGWLDEDTGVLKEDPKPGMLVAKVGGPAYRIGLGGGAASSRVSTTGTKDLDFDAVQRGDAQMCNRMNRLLRACLDNKNRNNLILSIHDQGCGGNGNVLKEIVEDSGATYRLSSFTLGDNSLTPLEIWGAEYQESNAILINAQDLDHLKKIAARERCGLDIVGTVPNDTTRTVRVIDDVTNPNQEDVVVDLPLDIVLGKLPPKEFRSDTPKILATSPVQIPSDYKDLRTLLKLVTALPAVGSKRFLVHKVDRSVTGLVARQQCVGPYQIPVSNCGVIARSHFSTEGCATAIGEAPQCSALDPAAMARRAVAEMLTNLCGAPISSRQDIRLSANWMWAAKLPGEGARMYKACKALSDALIQAQIAIDGGKDSLSMAAPDGAGNVVKSPGALTLTAYANCPDIRKVVTPELVPLKDARILFIDLQASAELGGTSLAQVFGQPGHCVSDVCDIGLISKIFDAVQGLLKANKVLAYHDRSDGGLIVALLEMAFASGRVGLDICLPDESDWILSLFSEGPGILLQVAAEEIDEIIQVLRAAGCAQSQLLTLATINTENESINVTVGEAQTLMRNVPVRELWAEWEAVSFAVERKQREVSCVEAEEASLFKRRPPAYKADFFSADDEQVAHDDITKSLSFEKRLSLNQKHKVAILRCEGSNGDREMAAAFYMAGLEPWDVTMSDLADGTITLDRFRGIVFVGGFSYADVCDSAKGWAASVLCNALVQKQFTHFYKDRKDVFSLGVCNGCQLMALLGWVPGIVEEQANAFISKDQPRFIHNASQKFESRWSTVTILESACELLKGMAGSVLGVWLAHGEGRAHFPQASVLEKVLEQNLAPLRYADDSGAVSDTYPYCPNGSPHGIAGLSSPDGRHLAIMPHPERAVLSWQWPWQNSTISHLSQQRSDNASPWLRLFQNAKHFLDRHDLSQASC